MKKINQILTRVAATNTNPATSGNTNNQAKPAHKHGKNKQGKGKPKHFLVAIGTPAAAQRLTLDPTRQLHYMIQFSNETVPTVAKKKGQVSAATSSEKRFAGQPVKDTTPDLLAMLDRRERRANEVSEDVEFLAELFGETGIDRGNHEEGDNGDMEHCHTIYTGFRGGSPDFGKKYKAKAA
ncbi:MAG: hypothetical protein WCG20_02585 [bacterium]